MWNEHGHVSSSSSSSSSYSTTQDNKLTPILSLPLNPIALSLQAQDYWIMPMSDQSIIPIGSRFYGTPWPHLLVYIIHRNSGMSIPTNPSSYSRHRKLTSQSANWIVISSAQCHILRHSSSFKLDPEHAWQDKLYNGNSESPTRRTDVNHFIC